MDLAHEDGKRAFLEELQRLVMAVEGLVDRQLLAATHCYGWTVADLLVHVDMGLQEMLPDFFATTEDPSSVDAATYWQTEVPTNDAAADEVDQTMYLRRVASAYRRPSGLVRRLSGTAAALARAAEQVAPGALVFQTHAITTGNYFATWAAELAVHHLDLMAHLDVPGPTPASLGIARRTVESLLAAPLPAGWSDTTAVLIGWGRAEPTPDQRRDAGPLADRLPVLS